MAGVQHLTVTGDEQDSRLDRWFKRRFPHIGHGRVEKLLRKGEIRVDGGRAKAGDRLTSGQVVRVPPLPEPGEEGAATARTPREDAPLSAEDVAFMRALVLYRDDDVIALNKPPGLPVQGGSGHSRHIDGLLDALRYDGEERPRLIHRLDKDTSGVLLLARSGRAAAALAAAFKSRATVKLYWGAVSGTPRPRAGTIRFGLVKEPGHGPNQAGEKMRCVHPDEIEGIEGAKRAVTDFMTVAALGERAAWVALKPVTGRTHQLRAHMSEMGCPIVGDGKYGTNRIEKQDGRYGAQLGGEISRKLHLHARLLDLPHPAGDRRLRIVAPLPEHMARTWASFGWVEADAPGDPFEET
ncbi:MAG: RluA family pseudouridine synthase [Rhodobacteraceae bacterium]|nr:RluA family pseudouridine synthase [Paracoccaceae bacterium]